jgi:hypothetical protein
MIERIFDKRTHDLGGGFEVAACCPTTLAAHRITDGDTPT